MVKGFKHLVKSRINTRIPCFSFSTAESLAENALKKPKQKIAFLLGYIGDRYKGLQVQTPSETEKDDQSFTPAVENLVIEALLKCGMLRESNAMDCKKMGWGRSSRTDKGVHAAGVVIGAKLLRDCSKSLKEELDQVNQYLPEDIRILGGCKVRGGFNPRAGQTHRVYEYLVPQNIVGPLLNQEMLNVFVGQNHCHNYTRKTTTSSTKPYSVDIKDPDIQQMDSVQKNMLHFRYDNFCVRHVLDFQYEMITVNDKPFVRFRIQGISFLYNQIRKIMGMVIGLSHGKYSLEMAKLSLKVPVSIPIPIAPGLPLFLHYKQGTFYNHRLDQDDLKDISHTTLEAVDKFKESIYDFIATSDTEVEFQNFFEELNNLSEIVREKEDLILSRYQEYLNISDGMKIPLVFEYWKRNLSN